MSLHEADMKSRLTRLLNRKSAPRLLDNNANAQADEITALLGVLTRYAPRGADDLAKWWYQFEPAISESCGRMWPDEKQIASVAKAVNTNMRGVNPTAPGPREASFNPVDRAAERMNVGEPVGEGWLYGRAACELIASGLVYQDTMRRYRSAAYFSRKAMYGEGPAKQWEDEAKEAHEHGRALWKSRHDREYRGDVGVPDKRAPTADMDQW